MRVLVVYCHPVETLVRPPRKIVRRYMRRLTGPQARVDYHAHYHMNVATEPQLKRFLQRVGQAMARFA